MLMLEMLPYEVKGDKRPLDKAKHLFLVINSLYLFVIINCWF